MLHISLSAPVLPPYQPECASAASPIEDCKLRTSLTARCILDINRGCFDSFGSRLGHSKDIVLLLDRLGGDSAKRPNTLFFLNSTIFHKNARISFKFCYILQNQTEFKI
jgi:hypothetical protein